MLIPFRIANLPAPPADSPRGRAPTVSQHDCAVANDVRAALGIARLGMSAVPDAPPRATVVVSGAADAARPTNPQPEPTQVVHGPTLRSCTVRSTSKPSAPASASTSPATS